VGGINDKLDTISATLNNLVQWSARHDGRHEGFERTEADQSKALWGNGEDKGLVKDVQHLKDECVSRHQALEAARVAAAAELGRVAEATAAVLAKSKMPRWQGVLYQAASYIVSAIVIYVLGYAGYIFLLHGQIK
jgi:hypothetical protein